MDQTVDHAETSSTAVIQGREGTRWDRVHVFISSTFNDMHAERDYLVKRVFPQLADWCEARRLRLVDVDLRWGVTEHDATRNRNVVQVCLGRIDECRPFFICLLGQRYGWVPGAGDVSPETVAAFPGLASAIAEGRSVTELEILHAMTAPFGEAARALPANAFFYQRHPASLRGIPSSPAQLRRTYSDAAETAPETRRDLRARLRHLRRVVLPATGRPIAVYRASWNAAARTPELELPLQCPAVLPENVERWRQQWRQAGVSVAQLDVAQDPEEALKARRFNDSLTRGRLTEFTVDGRSLADRIVADLQSAIDARFPGRVPAGTRDPLALELAQQSQFQFAAADGFVEREGDFTALDAAVSGAGDAPLVVTAAAGGGKSMLLARWIDRLARDADGASSVHYRFVGASDESSTVNGLLTFLLRELHEYAGKIDEAPPADPVRLRQVWPVLLARAGQTGRTVVVIDALDQLQDGLRDLTWIPRRLPAGVRFVVSLRRDAAGADAAIERFRRARSAIVEVPPFADPDDRRRLVRAYLSRFLKELDESHLEALIASPGAANPLFLKIVLNELRVFGAFANLGARIRNEFGVTPASAFDALLRRLESDPGYGDLEPAVAVPLVFGLLAHARRGLSAAELATMVCQALGHDRNDSAAVQSAADALHVVLRQVRPFLARRLGRFDFFYETFRNAARARYASGQDGASPAARPAVQWHAHLADYFHALPVWRQAPAGTRAPTERRAAELPYHLTMAGDGRRLGKILADLDFIEAKCTAGMTFDLADDFRRVPPELRTPALDQFSDFVRAKAHVLSRWPSLTFQEAANTVNAGLAEGQGAPARAAVFRQVTGLETRPWLRRLNPAPGANACRLTLAGHEGSVNGVTVTADGTRAVSVGIDRTLRVWDLHTGGAMEIVRDMGDAIPGLVSLPGTSLVAMAGPRGTVVLWDHELLQPVAELAAPAFGISCLAASADGTLVAVGTAARSAQIGARPVPSVLVHDIRRGEPLEFDAVTSGVQAIAIRAADAPIIVASAARIEAIDPRSGRVIATATAAGEQVTRLRFSPDGNLVLSSSWGGRVEFWRVPDLSRVLSLSGHQAIAQDLTLSPDGAELAVAGLDGTIRIWALETAESVAVLRGHTGLVTSAVWTPDGSAIVSACVDGMVRVWDPQFDRDFHALARKRLREDHGWRFSDLAPDRQAEVIERLLHTMTGVRKHAMTVTGVLGLPPGKRAVSVSMDDTARLWNLHSGQCEHVLEGHEHGVWDVAASRDGRIVATSDRNGTLRTWDVERAEEIASRSIAAGEEVPAGDDLAAGLALELRRPRVSPLRFALGDSVVVSADSLDPRIRLWDSRTLQPRGELAGHASRVRELAVIHDGGQLLSASEDGCLLRFDLASGRVLARGGCPQHRSVSARLGAFAVAGDGAVLYAWDDGSIRRLDQDTLRESGVLATGEGHVRWLIAARNLVVACREAANGMLVECWDDSGLPIWQRPVPSRLVRVAIDESATMVAIGSPDEGLVLRPIDPAAPERRYPAPASVVAFTGNRVIAGNEIGDVFLLEPS